MTGPKPRRLWTEGSLLDTPMGQTLAERLPVAGQPERIPPTDYRNYGKGDVVLTGHHGRFVKSCPGTPEYRCCGLQIIHFGLGCSLDCTYCILQSYLDSPALVLFGNMENGLTDLQNLLDQPDAPKAVLHRRVHGQPAAGTFHRVRAPFGKNVCQPAGPYSGTQEQNRPY